MENVIGHGSPYRKIQEQQEQWVGQWLDTYFYPYVSGMFSRNIDTETQKRGVDVYLTGNTKAISIDEKAGVAWCNSNLNKYSLELSILTIDEFNRKHEINGWYLSDSLSTHMALVFINSAQTYNERYLASSAITDATVVVIDKKKFQEKLDIIGWTKQNLKAKSDQIRNAWNVYGKDYKYHVSLGTLNNNDIHFYLQETQKEEGICMQFAKHFLIDVSDFTYRITDGKMERLK